MRLRLPHGLLLHGPEGVGQFELAMAFAQLLLCERSAAVDEVCGNCPSCNWFALGNHPDFRLVQPDSLAAEEEGSEAPDPKKTSDQIRIEQVRDLQRFLAVGTHRGGLRVIVLHPADTMNVATQNALLKSLEEPPPNTLFVLATSLAHRLLPTVRSRCRGAAIPLPDRDQAGAWLRAQGVEDPARLLALAGGAPLSALRLADTEAVRRQLVEDLRDSRFDPVSAAERCLKAEPGEVVAWVQRWVYDLLSWRIAGVIRYHQTEQKALAPIASRCDPVQTAALLRRLAQARGLASHPLNPRLFLEDLLIAYQTLVGAGSSP